MEECDVMAVLTPDIPKEGYVWCRSLLKPRKGVKMVVLENLSLCILYFPPALLWPVPTSPKHLSLVTVIPITTSIRMKTQAKTEVWTLQILNWPVERLWSRWEENI
jgi:hypothetical protein